MCVHDADEVMPVNPVQEKNPSALNKSSRKSSMSVSKYPFFPLSPWQLCSKGSCLHIWSHRKCESLCLCARKVMRGFAAL